MWVLKGIKCELRVGEEWKWPRGKGGGVEVGGMGSGGGWREEGFDWKSRVGNEQWVENTAGNFCTVEREAWKTWWGPGDPLGCPRAMQNGGRLSRVRYFI